jgi:hypothetical protein
MTDWHDHERTCAAVIKGKRYPANTGGRVDVESGTVVAQCKERATISSPEVVRLVAEMDALGFTKGKVGVLFLRLKSGRGTPSPGMVVMTHRVFAQLLEEAYPDAGPG